MTTNRIIITNQERTESNILTASINLPHKLTPEILDELVQEFRTKVLSYSQKSPKKVFSNISRVPQISETSINQNMSVVSQSQTYQDEVLQLKIDQVVQAMQFLKILELQKNPQAQEGSEKELKFKNHEILLVVDGNQIIVTNPSVTNFYTLNLKDFVVFTYNLTSSHISLEEFSKKISYAWENISF